MEDLSKKTNEQLIKEISNMSLNYEQIKNEIKALCDIAESIEATHALYLVELDKRI